MKQNITIAIEKELVRKARVLAARRDTSLNRMLAEQLLQLVSEEERYASARRKALGLLQAGFSLGGTISATREQLHER